MHELGLLRAGQPGNDTVVDVGLLDPARHRLLGHVEVDRDLRDCRLTPTSDRDDVPLELRGNSFGIATSSLRDRVPQNGCQPERQQTQRGMKGAGVTVQIVRVLVFGGTPVAEDAARLGADPSLDWSAAVHVPGRGRPGR